jgi:hypothetical protein
MPDRGKVDGKNRLSAQSVFIEKFLMVVKNKIETKKKTAETGRSDAAFRRYPNAPGEPCTAPAFNPTNCKTQAPVADRGAGRSIFSSVRAIEPPLPSTLSAALTVPCHTISYRFGLPVRRGLRHLDTGRRKRFKAPA